MVTSHYSNVSLSPELKDHISQSLQHFDVVKFIFLWSDFQHQYLQGIFLKQGFCLYIVLQLLQLFD